MGRQLPLLNHSFKQSSGLIRSYPAKLRRLPSCDSPVGPHVLENHLLHLLVFKALQAHVGRLFPSRRYVEAER